MGRRRGRRRRRLCVALPACARMCLVPGNLACALCPHNCTSFGGGAGLQRLPCRMLILRRVTSEESVACFVVDVVASSFSVMGWAAYPAYAGLLLIITIYPVLSAILFIILAGTLWPHPRHCDG